MLNIEIVSEHRQVRIACRGALDAGTVDRFIAAAARVIAGGERAVVADLSALLHLDSSGIGALSHLFRRLAQAGRRLEVEGTGGQPLALLRATGLDRILAPGAARAARPRGFGAPRGLPEGA